MKRPIITARAPGTALSQYRCHGRRRRRETDAVAHGRHNSGKIHAGDATELASAMIRNNYVRLGIHCAASVVCCVNSLLRHVRSKLRGSI